MIAASRWIPILAAVALGACGDKAADPASRPGEETPATGPAAAAPAPTGNWSR